MYEETRILLVWVAAIVVATLSSIFVGAYVNELLGCALAVALFTIASAESFRADRRITNDKTNEGLGTFFGFLFAGVAFLAVIAFVTKAFGDVWGLTSASLLCLVMSNWLFTARKGSTTDDGRIGFAIFGIATALLAFTFGVMSAYYLLAGLALVLPGVIRGHPQLSKPQLYGPAIRN